MLMPMTVDGTLGIAEGQAVAARRGMDQHRGQIGEPRAS
jgi:hypothetical protein